MCKKQEFGVTWGAQSNSDEKMTDIVVLSQEIFNREDEMVWGKKRYCKRGQKVVPRSCNPGVGNQREISPPGG